MAGDKVNWSIWELPVGTEDLNHHKNRVFRGDKEAVLKQYERLRQEEATGGGLVVTNEHGDPVYACS